MDPEIKTNVRHEGVKPTYDIVAKRILSNTEITLQFIKDILDIPAVSAKILDGTQIHLAKDEVATDFYMAVDVLVELDDDSQVIIEIQLAHQAYFINRLWAYMCGEVNSNVEKLRQEIGKTHIVYDRLAPVYVIAVVEENYFDDDRAFRSFSMRDDYNYDILKVGNIGIAKTRSISKIAFLELKKYNPEIKTEYNRKRWLEFFGNKPYTKEPDSLLNQADTILDMRTWTKEEKRMYDERTRMIEQQLAANESARIRGELSGMEIGMKKGYEKGIEQGLEQGIEQGRIEGKIQALTKMVSDGHLTKEIAAQGLGISVEEFEKYL